MNEETHTKKEEAKPENPDAKPNDEKHTTDRAKSVNWRRCWQSWR